MFRTSLLHGFAVPQICLKFERYTHKEIIVFKKILKGIGIVLLAIIALFVSIGIYTGYKSSSYEETAVPYIKEVIEEFSKWDVEQAKPYFDNKVLENTKAEDLEKMFKWFSKLGDLKSIQTLEFRNISSGVTTSEGAHTAITYIGLLNYEKGDANLTIILLEKENGFSVYGFKLNSMALIE